MTRHVTDFVRSKIRQWEGKRLTAYRDSVGVWTIGYGHTGPDVRAGLTITEARADETLARDLVAFETTVSRAVKVDLTDNQFGALVSFAFNVGAAAFQSSTLLRKLNAGSYDAVPGELAKWNKGTIDGRRVPLAGLTNRRAAEAGLWASGAHVASKGVPASPKASVSAAGLLRKPETLAGGVSMFGALAGAAANGGPVAWATALLIVAAVAGGGVYFFRRLQGSE